MQDIRYLLMWCHNVYLVKFTEFSIKLECFASTLVWFLCEQSWMESGKVDRPTIFGVFRKSSFWSLVLWKQVLRHFLIKIFMLLPRRRNKIDVSAASGAKTVVPITFARMEAREHWEEEVLANLNKTGASKNWRMYSQNN
jgi:hypothetical protein